MKLRLLIASALAGGALSAPAMAEVQPYIGQVSMVGGTFCPRDWVEPNGQLLAIADYSALFALYGPQYGGDGRISFALPDLRSRSPEHFNVYPLGFKRGWEDETMTIATMPAHSHRLMASNTAATQPSPTGNDLGQFIGGAIPGYSDLPPDPNVTLNSNVLSNEGFGSPFGIRQPSIGIRFCVALEGIFPPRN